jgi:hypothetical protein
MKNVWNWVKNNPNRTMFLVPIILVAVISISHVVAWYDIANPLSWAIYLSIAIEVGAMTALVAAINKIKGGVWFMFGLVTFVQMIGNIFFSFKEVDPNSDLFKAWIELTGPIWELVGSDINDITSMKRWLAFLEGGLLPIISLTSLHFFIKYDDGKQSKVEINNFQKSEDSQNIKETIIQNFENKIVKNEVSVDNEIISDTQKINSQIDDKQNILESNENYIIGKSHEEQDLRNEILRQQTILENQKIQNQIDNSNTNDWRNTVHTPLQDKVDESKKKSETQLDESVHTKFEKEIEPEIQNEIPSDIISESTPKLEPTSTPKLELPSEPNLEKVSQFNSETISEPISTSQSEIDSQNNDSEKEQISNEDYVSNEEKKFEVEQFELTSESEIVDIPLDVNFDSSNTIGKKLSYKRGT